MKFMLRTAQALIIPLIMLASDAAASPDAKEIVRRSDYNSRGEKQYAEIKMTIIRPEWTRSLSLKTWSLGSDYSMILITAPARERGQVFLKRGSEMWNWVPSIERIVSIPASMMMQSWMGSDFTNDDLLNEASIVNDYNHKIVGEEESGGLECWKIELLPLDDAPVVWGKIYLWISKQGYHQMRSEYFDEYGDLINYHTAKDIKTLGGREIVTYIEVVPADKKGHRTVLEIEKADFSPNIEESFFSQQNMRRVR